MCRLSHTITKIDYFFITGVSKEGIREEMWNYLESTNIAQFPRPVHHRIPNFKVTIIMFCVGMMLSVVSSLLISHKICQIIFHLDKFVFHARSSWHHSI